MTDLATRIADARKKAKEATPGPWHHCQPFEIVPAQRTIHGPVPAQRVDYVSTWPDLGTPKGHRVVIPMPGREGSVKSEDMAYIAAASPDLIIEMADEIDRLTASLDATKAQLEKAREALKPLTGYAGKDFQAVPGDIIVYVRFDIIRAAARVHAELAEKEKENVIS